MAKAQTENFWEMVIELETSGNDLPPAPIFGSSISNASPAEITVPITAIENFISGDVVYVSGITTAGFTAANGTQTVGTVDSSAGTFALLGIDLSANASPLSDTISIVPALRAPAPVQVLSIDNSSPAVAQVAPSDIGKFTNGVSVTIAGVTGTGMTAANGAHTVANLNTTNNTFELGTLDLASGLGPATSGITAQLPTPTLQPLVWAKFCGLNSRSITRQHTMQTTEVPDCDDESLPASIERSVQSSEITIAGTGVWAAQSHQTMMEWWRAGKPRNIRVGHLKADSGDVMYEMGPAYLTQLNHTAERGTKVTAEINIEFDGMPQIAVAP